MNDATCPYVPAFDLLARRHCLTIIWFLQQSSPRRFTEFRQDLHVNPVTLTQRLGELERARIVTRTVFQEIPPRVEYALTPKGRDLVHLMEKMCEWACKWDSKCAEEAARQETAAVRR